MKPRLLPLLPCLLFLAGILAFVLGGRYSGFFPLDDAWIHCVYARAFAFGHGFAYNRGVQEAGATSPLWVIVTAPAQWLGGLGIEAVVAGVKTIGTAFGLLSVWSVQQIARRATASAAVAVVAASLFALEPRLLFSSLSGMETPLLLALWLGGIHALLARRWTAFALLFSLIPLARPEGLVLIPFCVLAMFVANSSATARRRLLLSVTMAVPFALWMLACHGMTGHWLPNTYYVKSQPFHIDDHALASAWAIITADGFASVFVFFIGIAAFVARFAGRGHLLLLLLSIGLPLVYLLGVLGTRPILPDGYYWTRWLDPVSLMLTAAFAVGFALILTGGAGLVGRLTIPSWRARALMIITGAVVCLACAPAFVHSFRDRRFHLMSDARAIDRLNVQAGLWIRDHTPADAKVAVTDGGAIRYFGERHTLDLWGLNCHEIALRQVTVDDMIMRSDWVAIFPLTFQPHSYFVEYHFIARQEFQIPEQEYTVCITCWGQTRMVVYRKKVPPPNR